MYTFESYATILNKVDIPENLKKLISNEPMFLKSTKDYVMENGGELIKFLIENLPDDWKDSEIAIDSRSHMLMKGMYPCIPAFHHDYVERSRVDGQPNYDTASYRSEHLLLLINADVSSTRFAVGTATYSEVEVGEKVYNNWHKETLEHLESGKLVEQFTPDCTWVQFDDISFHEGTKASKNGWRYFIRVSRFFDSVTAEPTGLPKIHNSIRKQVQVYLDDYSIGW